MTLTMNAPQTLDVDYDELMARADEIDAPVPGLPTDNPQAPCLLAMVLTAADQLGLSANNMRTYLRTGIEREWPKLAENLRKAAKAYEEVDENAAAAIDNGTSMSAVTRGWDEDLDQVVLTDTQVAAGGLDEYQDLKQRAWDIEHSDQGASFDNFAEAWTAYRQTLLVAANRFRPFENYDGEAAYALEETMDAQRQWLVQMAELCATMATQARTVASTQRWALPEHIWMDYETGRGQLWGHFLYGHLVVMEQQFNDEPDRRNEIMLAFADLQQQSDVVMAEYVRRAALPVAPINPQKPPYVQAAPDSNPDDGRAPDAPSDELPTNDPSGASGGSSGGAADTSGDQAPTDPPTTPPPGTPTGGGVKPASFGGGGGGIPSLALQPPVEAEAAPRPTAAAPAASLVGAGTGARGAMGGGIGMPMGGHGGQNQNDRKGKRCQQEDEALYKEDRPWTAPVIGNRRRNDLPDGDCRTSGG